MNRYNLKEALVLIVFLSFKFTLLETVSFLENEADKFSISYILLLLVLDNDLFFSNIRKINRLSFVTS